MIWCRRKTVVIPLMIAALLLAEAGGWFLNTNPSTDCLVEVSAPGRVTRARAIETVVQPWRGPHHVYGVFSIPSGFEGAKRYAVTVSVDGVLRYCMWVEKPLSQKGELCRRGAGNM